MLNQQTQQGGDHHAEPRLRRPAGQPAADLEPTHINLNDRTLEGMRHRSLPVFSVQYHPEASAGPHDSGYLFEQFRKMMG